MPSSAPSILGWAFEHVERLRPKRVLDIGIGFGKWGFLTKEYAEKRQPSDKSNCHLVGVEAFPEYVTPLTRMIYDKIIIGDIRKVALEDFDLIIMGDVIEHFEKSDGEKLLDELRKHCKYLLISTPVVFANQEAEYGNQFEIHRSHWNAQDFQYWKQIDSYQRGCVWGVLLKGDIDA